MFNAQQRNSLLERRAESQHNNALWENLTLTQKFAASSLSQTGYEVAFIRQSRSGNVAVLFSDDSTATISSEGEIDTNPYITIR